MIAAEQARVWAMMAVCGFVLGGAYDALGCMRQGGVAWMADLLFGPACALAMIAAGLVIKTDVFRLYTFLGIALGMAVYMLTIGAALRRAKRFLWRAAKKEIVEENLCKDAGKGKRRANFN